MSSVFKEGTNEEKKERAGTERGNRPRCSKMPLTYRPPGIVLSTGTGLAKESQLLHDYTVLTI